MRCSKVASLAPATVGAGYEVVGGQGVGCGAWHPADPARSLFGQHLGADAAVFCSEAAVCRSCNGDKGAKLLIEWRTRPAMPSSRLGH